MCLKKMDYGVQVDIPIKYWRWKLAERFGWTLDVIDGLPLAELYEYIQIADGEMRAGKRQTLW